MRAGQTAVTLRGQVPAGAQYAGQHAGMLGLQQHPGQHLLAGSAEEVPFRDPRRCSKTRLVEDKHQHCNAWASKKSDLRLCVGHQREHEKALNDGDESSADEGLHPASS